MSERKLLRQDTVVPFLAELFERQGAAAYLGEPVTVAEHMLQSAALAERDGCDADIIVAALLHDVGHLTGTGGTFSMDDTHDRHHEVAGAALLAPLLPQRVVDCVRHHVDAKRFLCATRPQYLNRLSPASVHSLGLQGGPMSDAQAAVFAGQAHLQAIISVRQFDDAAKVAGATTPPFSHFAPLLQQVVAAHCQARQ